MQHIFNLSVTPTQTATVFAGRSLNVPLIPFWFPPQLERIFPSPSLSSFWCVFTSVENNFNLSRRTTTRRKNPYSLSWFFLLFFFSFILTHFLCLFSFFLYIHLFLELKFAICSLPNTNEKKNKPWNLTCFRFFSITFWYRTPPSRPPWKSIKWNKQVDP